MEEKTQIHHYRGGKKCLLSEEIEILFQANKWRCHRERELARKVSPLMSHTAFINLRCFYLLIPLLLPLSNMIAQQNLSQNSHLICSQVWLATLISRSY
jgi:hypothetical protein